MQFEVGSILYQGENCLKRVNTLLWYVYFRRHHLRSCNAVVIIQQETLLPWITSREDTKIISPSFLRSLTKQQRQNDWKHYRKQSSWKCHMLGSYVCTWVCAFTRWQKKMLVLYCFHLRTGWLSFGMFLCFTSLVLVTFVVHIWVGFS